MPRPPTRTAALALLLLSACDSTGPSPNPLVGVWAVSGATSRTLVTVSEAQSVPDPSGATAGSLAFSGAEQGTFRSVRTTSTSALLATYDLRDASAPADGARLAIEAGTLSLSVAGGGTERRYSATGQDTAVTVADGRVTVVRPVVLTGASGQVTVQPGTVALPLVTLPAGLPVALGVTTDAAPTDPFYGQAYDPARVRYVFSDRGAFRIDDAILGALFVGTWELVADSLRLTVQRGAFAPEARTVRASVDGSTLRVSSRFSACGGVAGCLRAIGASVGLRPETVTDVSREVTNAFRPARVGA